MRCLKKRHLENYFLDSSILAKVAVRFYLDDKWKKQEEIERELKHICNNSLQEALDLLIKDFLRIKLNIPIPRPKDIQGKSTQKLREDFIQGVISEVTQLDTELSQKELDKKFKLIEKQLKTAIENGKIFFLVKYCSEKCVTH